MVGCGHQLHNDHPYAFMSLSDRDVFISENNREYLVPLDSPIRPVCFGGMCRCQCCVVGICWHSFRTVSAHDQGKTAPEVCWRSDRHFLCFEYCWDGLDLLLLCELSLDHNFGALLRNFARFWNGFRCAVIQFPLPSQDLFCVH